MTALYISADNSLESDIAALDTSANSSLDNDTDVRVWMVGRYSLTGNGGCVDLQGDYTLAEALALAPRLPSPIAADGAEDQIQITLAEIGAIIATNLGTGSLSP